MRLDPRVFSRASRIHRYLPMLVPVCGGVEPALRELKWIQHEYRTTENKTREKFIFRACYRRGVLQEPLQYILGNQPFGDLTIKCSKGVLIPRWETEEWCLRLGQLIKPWSDSQLTIVDYCTGTGCIGLLLSTFVKDSKVIAVDKSDQAVRLCKENWNLYKQGANGTNRTELEIVQADVLNDSVTSEADLIVANPPYIPMSDYYRMERSVRLHEPHLALQGDMEFYTAIFEHFVSANLKARALVMEVGDERQIEHVKELSQREDLRNNLGITSWVDGAGLARVVIVWRKDRCTIAF